MLVVKIYFLNFRFAKCIIKKQYFDREIKSAASRISRTYLTTLIFVAGLIGAIMAGGSRYGGLLCLVWILLDLLLINPAIYYALLPKPLSRHVLSEEEAAEEMKKEETGSSIDEILSKYESVEKRRR